MAEENSITGIFKGLSEEVVLPGEINEDSGVEEQAEEVGEGLNVTTPKITNKEILNKLEEGRDLMSEDIMGAISGEEVKVVMLKESEHIEEPNIAIDLRDLQKISRVETDALRGLLREDGNVALYIIQPRVGVVKLGYALKGMMDKVLVRVIYNILGEDIKIYENFQIDKENKLLNKNSLVSRRMNI